MGGKKYLKQFMVDCMQEIGSRELISLRSTVQHLKKDLSQAQLTKMTLDDIIETFKGMSFGAGAPQLWTVLQHLACTGDQQSRNTYKSPTLVSSVLCPAVTCDMNQRFQVVTFIMWMLLYSQSHHNSDGLKFLTLFLKLQGISAKSLDVLHAFGITMSYKWAVEAVEQLASAQMSEVRDVVQSGQPWFMSYNNVNIPFRTFAQCIDHQHHFNSGTAATIYIQPHAPPIPALSFQALQTQCAIGGKTPITFQKIISLECEAAQRSHPHFVWCVLHALLSSPDFDLATYSAQDSPAFTPPKPNHELPCGHDYITKQYVLETQQVDEASYDGNLKLLGIWQEQLGLGSHAQKIVTGTDCIIVVGGDQLTVE